MIRASALAMAVFALLVSSPVSRASEASSDRASETIGVLSVTLVGTGSAIANPIRSGPCQLVRYEDVMVLVDMGTGTQERLRQLRVGVDDIQFILFTHHHIDHNAEFPAILDRAILGGNLRKVVGPPGTARLVDFVWEFYQDDLHYRAREPLQRPNVLEVGDGDSLSVGPIHVRVAKMNHPIYTNGYRFEAGGSSIVLSGDTAYSRALVDLARGADVLVVDGGLAVRRLGVGGDTLVDEQIQSRSAASLLHQERWTGSARAHATLDEICSMAEEAGVRHLVLVHLGGRPVAEDVVRQAIRMRFKGEITVGQDLMTINAR